MDPESRTLIGTSCLAEYIWLQVINPIGDRIRLSGSLVPVKEVLCGQPKKIRLAPTSLAGWEPPQAKPAAPKVGIAICMSRKRAGSCLFGSPLLEVKGNQSQFLGTFPNVALVLLVLSCIPAGHCPSATVGGTEVPFAREQVSGSRAVASDRRDMDDPSQWPAPPIPCRRAG